MRATRPRGHVALPTLLLALAFAAVSAGYAVRSVWVRIDPPLRPGHYGPEVEPRARALIERLARGLIALQRPDGGFDLGAEGGYSYQIERIAASSLATAALAHVRSLRPRLPVQGLDEALARALDFVSRQQLETGAVGLDEPHDRWSQVDATSAGLLAFLLSGRPGDRDAAAGAARAMARFARAGLRNGWTRALAIMVVDRAVQEGHVDVFDRPWRELVDIRALKQKPADDGTVQSSDWNVAEAIARAVLGIRKGVDPFPAQVVTACLADRPRWSGPSSDCQAWWMQSWLVSRSGSEESRPWFLALVEVLETEALEADGTVHGGWYANTVNQTVGALFALSAGLSAEV